MVESDIDIYNITEDERVTLVGEPHALRGAAYLRNRGPGKISLREARVLCAPLQSAMGQETASPVPVALSSATLHPGQAQSVALTLELDRHTPPGEYSGELEIAGRTRPVIMHVAEAPRLRISPKSVVIDRRADETVVKRVVFANEGNVPLRIGALGDVLLGEDLLLRRSLSVTLAAVGEQRRPLEDLFAEIARDEAKTMIRESGFLQVRNRSLTLRPGEVSPLDLEIRLPEKLKTNTRYIGRAPLYTTELEFVIVMMDGERQ
jgi:hypothetical protein